jgi:hypothetical protein
VTVFEQEGAEIIDLKPRHFVMRVNTNSTERQVLETVAERIPNPEEISEFQNDNVTQPGNNLYSPNISKYFYLKP